MLEVLVAAVIIFVVLATAIVVYFLAVLQGLREIVDSEVKAISRSVEHAIRAGARANLSDDRRSFFADVEGVRIFVPLPGPGRPAVELPDYNEDIDGTTWGGAVFDPPGVGAIGDIDWDGNGILSAPAFAKPELASQRNDGLDNDGDGIPDDGPTAPTGQPESFLPPGLGQRSPAYDRLDNDPGGNDGAVDDVARYLFPLGLLAYVDDGSYKEGLSLAGTSAWFFQSSLGARSLVLDPIDEDLNGDGFVSTSGPHITPIPPQLIDTHREGALVRNSVPLFLGAFYPDTFEDRDGDARIGVQPSTVPFGLPGVLVDLNGDSIPDYNEFAEDFNLNGFLDVPVKGQFPGSVFYHSYYGPGGPTAPIYSGDPLTQGLLQTPAPGPGVVIQEPYQSANFHYSSQIQQSRNFGYTMRVERVEGRSGSSQGFGVVDRTVYRITLAFYYDYARAVEGFRMGEPPEPVRVQSFEVIVE